MEKIPIPEKISQKPTREQLEIMIREAQRALGVPEKDFSGVPERLPSWDGLEGVKVLMVDDRSEIIDLYVPEMTVATEGNFDYLLHKGEGVSSLVDVIMTKKPELILLDYSLASGVKGSEVVLGLRERGFPGKIIGFSAEDFSQVFQQVGADVSVTKSSYDAKRTVSAIAQAIGEL